MRESSKSVVALIPARSGSKRVPNKNIKRLGEHPLIAYTIAAAIESRIFSDVICVTNDSHYGRIAEYYGAHVPFLRPGHTATDTSPDIEWVKWTLAELAKTGKVFDAFAILRPTSPFRQAATIQRAWRIFLQDLTSDSIRAVSLCTEHPGKMWVMTGDHMQPLLHGDIDGVPWHSSPYGSLPRIYVQNASLEITWSHVAESTGTIAGEKIAPFISDQYEGFDINTSSDWLLADLYLQSRLASLPKIKHLPLPLSEL